MKNKENECVLLIIPLCDENELKKFELEVPVIKKLARNHLFVDDEFYDDLLARYKKWKVVEKL